MTNSEDEFKDFPFVKIFKYGTIYSKCKIYGITEETEEEESTPISINTRIGVLNSEEDDIETIIIITKDTEFYSWNGSLTCDNIVDFKLDDNVYYCPAQEPVDSLEHDFQNGGGCRLENANELQKISKKFKLDHFLISV